MNKVIIYFTRKERLALLGLSPRYLTFNTTESILITYSVNTYQIFLINDEINLEEFQSNVWNDIKEKKFAFIYHTKPTSDIIDFLHLFQVKNQTIKLSQKGSHQKLMEGYLLYKPLKKIISSGNFTKSDFDFLWKKIELLAYSETQINKIHKQWLQAIRPSNQVILEQTTIYIGNTPKKYHSKIQTYGLKIQTPKELLSKFLDNKTRLIFLCEINVDEKGEPVKRTDYYGIKLAQKIRQKGFSGNILFISNRSKDLFFKEKLAYKLLFLPRGHFFSELPKSIKELINDLDKIVPLDALSLRDVQLFSSNILGIVRERLHTLDQSSINTKESQIILLKDLYSYYGEPFDNVIEGYNKISSSKNIFLYTEKKCKDILNKYTENSNTENSSLGRTWPNWSILWLDDEIYRTYERGKDIAIVEELTSRGINIIKASSFEEARSVWEEDQVTLQSITVIIADYRLNNLDNDGVLTQNLYQGYDFLKSIMEENTPLALFVYSGLPRKFLIETFTYYEKKIHFFSKKDFPLNKNESFNHICDEIIEQGDNAWITINNQPTSAEWKKNDGKNKEGLFMNQVFFKFKSTHQYYIWNSHCNQKTKENLERYKRGEVLSFKITGSNFTSSPNKQEERLKEILLARRFIITKLAEASNVGGDLILEKKKLGDRIYELSSKKKASKKTADTIFNRLALDVTNFPLFLLPEEYAWLNYDCGFLNILNSEKITKTYFSILEDIRNVFGKTFKKFPNGFLQSKIDKKGFYTIKKIDFKEGVIEKINVKKELLRVFDNDSMKRLFYFDIETYIPIFRTALEIKAILYSIYLYLTPNNNYEKHLSEYYTLLYSIRSIIQYRWNNPKIKSVFPKSLKTLFTFIDDLPSKTKILSNINKTKENIIEEYKRLYAPWEYAHPFKKDKNSRERRKTNLINACTNLNLIKDTWEGYLNVNEEYRLLMDEEVNSYENKINKAIYNGVIKYNKGRIEENNSKYKEIEYSPLIDVYHVDEVFEIEIGSYENFEIDNESEELVSRFYSFMKKIKFIPSFTIPVKFNSLNDLLSKKIPIDESRVTSEYLLCLIIDRQKEMLLEDNIINFLNEFNLLGIKNNYIYILNMP